VLSALSTCLLSTVLFGLSGLGGALPGLAIGALFHLLLLRTAQVRRHL